MSTVCCASQRPRLRLETLQQQRQEPEPYVPEFSLYSIYLSEVMKDRGL